MGKGKKKKILKKVLLGILAAIVSVPVAFFVINLVCMNNLKSYIRSFDPVDYTGLDRPVPVLDEERGIYTITTGRDFKIMVLTDVHLGGGHYMYKEDKKTVYEVITMLQKEKPDLVVLDGDNIFATPGPVFNGGGTLSNKRASENLIEIFEHEGVYFTTVFGNHDSETFNFTSRSGLGKLYESEKYAYSIYRSEFSDTEAKIPSVTNQMLALKNTDGEVSKLLLLIDTNAYVNKSIKAVLDWDYDTIHDAQVNWASEEIKKQSSLSGLSKDEYHKVLTFLHIPIGEYEESYRELAANSFQNTENTKYIEGVWDEEYVVDRGIRTYFGGCRKYYENPVAADSFFETLGPDGMNCLEAVFCGHDHVNNAVVIHKGVMLSYGYSLDNRAYTGIASYGKQRGCTIITVSPDGSWNQEHKNVYIDYDADTSKFMDVNINDYFYSDPAPVSNLLVIMD